jgi:hypothetical protein
MKWAVIIIVENFKNDVIVKYSPPQLILSRKGGGGMYLVSATPTKLLIEF